MSETEPEITIPVTKRLELYSDIHNPAKHLK